MLVLECVSLKSNVVLELVMILCSYLSDHGTLFLSSIAKTSVLELVGLVFYRVSTSKLFVFCFT